MQLTPDLTFKYDEPAVQQRSNLYTLKDPALAEFLGFGASNPAGVTVNENNSLGLTAVYRSVSLIAGTIASLPMKTYVKNEDGTRAKVSSFLDDPGRLLGLTPFAWKELVMVHLLLHGNAFLLNRYNNAGVIIGLEPIHPFAVSVEVKDGRKVFTVTMADGSIRRSNEPGDNLDITHIMALSADGVMGLSPIQATRSALGTSIAADTAAARMYGNGLLLGGILSSSDETLTQEDAQELLDGFKRAATGTGHAGDIAFLNAAVRFDRWTMSAEDAQFIQSRAFQVEEISRIFGVPPHLLSQTDKQTSWGTGVSEQNRGLARYTLMPWTSRVEEQLSTLIQASRYVEFEYAGLLQPSQTEVTDNIIKEINAGILTKNEARILMNRPPLPENEEDNGTEEA